MRLGPVVRFGSVASVNRKRRGAPIVFDKVLDPAGKPKLCAGDRGFAGSLIDDLVIKPDKGVHFRPFRVFPKGDDLRRWHSHKFHFSVVKIRLNICNTGLYRANSQAFDLFSESIVKNLSQCFAVSDILGYNGKGLGKQIVSLLLDQLPQYRMFDLGIGPVFQIGLLFLHVRPVPVIPFRVNHDLIFW